LVPCFPRDIPVKNKREYWPGGIWGDPTKAGPQKGTLCLEAVIKALVALIEKLENWKE
jgi:creatinine amidohydrolase